LAIPLSNEPIFNQLTHRLRE